MYKILSMMKSNIGFSLFLVNFLLLLVALGVSDPFGIFQSVYSNADSWIDEKEKIESIKIEHKSSANQVDFQQTIKRNQNVGISKNWAWRVEIEKKDYPGDFEKTNKILNTIYNLRKYTFLGRDTHKYGFNENYIRFLVQIENNPSRKFEFSVSMESDREGESYLMDESGEIYLIPFSLPDVLGRHDPYHFISNRFFHSNEENPVMMEHILSIQLNHGAQKVYHLAKDSKNWYILGKENQISEFDGLNSILEGIINLKSEKVYLESKSDWKKIKPWKIQIGFQTDSIPVYHSMECSWEDPDSNKICRIQDRNGFYLFNGYELGFILDRKEKDFLKPNSP